MWTYQRIDLLQNLAQNYLDDGIFADIGNECTEQI